MDVEQTNQLLQLTLNSVLLMMTCVILLSGWMARHITVSDRLWLLQQEHLTLHNPELSSDRDRSVGQRTDRQHADRQHVDRQHADRQRTEAKQIHRFKSYRFALRRQYRLTQASVVAALYALLCAIGSTLSIVCRALVNWNGLIYTTLILFLVGLSLMLLSIGLVLVDIHYSSRSLWQEIVETWSPNSNRSIVIQPNEQSVPARRILRKFVPR